MNSLQRSPRAAWRSRLIGATVGLVPALSLAGTATWVGPSGSYWDLPANWSPSPPGGGDDAALGNFNTEFRSGPVGIRSFAGTGVLTLSGGAALSITNASTIGGLTMSSGSIGGTGSLTVTGASTINFGDFRGSGTTALLGPTTVTTGGGLLLDGSRTLSNQNTLTWDNGVITFNGTIGGGSASEGAGTINNVGTFVASGDFANAMVVAEDPGSGDLGAGAMFVNPGTFVKSGSSASHTTTLAVPFVHTGLVNVQSGILTFNAGTTGNGAYSLSPGATLQFGPGAHALSGTLTAPVASTVRTSGLNSVAFDSSYSIGGTLEMQGSLLNLGANALTVAALTQSNGGISGSGLLTVTGPTTIMYGDHRGTGTTTLQGPTTIGPSGFRLDGGRTVINQNTVTWTGGPLIFNDTFDGAGTNPGSGTFDNTQPATFVASGPFTGLIDVAGGPAGSDALFVNSGTFVKSGSGVNDQTTINVPFTHSGPVQIQTGILSFNVGGAHPGAFAISPGATLRFDAGDHTVSGPLSAPANSTVLVSGTANVTLAMPYTLDGTLQVQNLTLDHGAKTLVTANLQQSGGSIGGGGWMIVSGATTFTGGDHRGSGMTTLRGPTSISTNGLRLDGGRTIVNQDAVTWTGGTITFNNTFNGASGGPGSGTFHNLLGSVFIASGGFAGAIDANDFGPGDNGSDALFINAGKFIKSDSDPNHVTTITVPLQNTGVIDIQTGILVVLPNFTNAGTVKGVGKFATSVFTNGGHLAPGGSPGTLTLLGNLVQGAGGSVDIELSGTGSADLLTVTGSATLGGTLALKCVPGACNVTTNDEFVILHSEGALSGTFVSTTSSGFRPGFAYTVSYDYAAGNVKVKVTDQGSPPQLTVVKAGRGTGTVTSGDGFIACGGTCVHGYPATTAVMLTATADAGSTFVGWLGACSGTGSNVCVVSVDNIVSVKATFMLGAVPPMKLDVDGNGGYDALTDGLIAIRYLLDITGPALVTYAINDDASITAPEILARLIDLGPYLDVDGDGTLDARTDGLLIVRHMFGVRGKALVEEALGERATRTEPGAVASYLDTLLQ